MRAIIVDDEKQSHTVLINLLTKHHPDIQVLASEYNVQGGYDLVNKHQPDLVFLDIEMPDGLGFDLLKKLGSPNFNVIFITAHEHYALRAIRFEALDYLLKPINSEELAVALDKARKKQKELISEEQLRRLLDMIEKDKEQKLPSRIGIPTLDGIIYKSVSDIIRLEAQQNYTEFTFLHDTKKILASINIGEYETLFEPYKEFMRVHRSHVVNLKYVERYVRGDGGYLVMRDEAEVSVSRRYKDDLLDRLESF